MPPPSGFRLFAGSIDFAGNTLAFDNFSITPEPATFSLLALAGLIGLRRRR
ncbi:MAG: PEP-CTERM sorting domain-containing protein [Planctomycetes bacterium]|nr:PEP-CTERM sorting domain-containing protein [Planctomycetota bacterium]